MRALDAANYLLTLDAPSPEERETSNLKLQKLLYYAQGIHLARNGVALFSEPLQAWPHGPVCPHVYRAFKHHGANPIPADSSFRADSLSAEERATLNEAFDRYGQFSANHLRNMTHGEAPWKSVYCASERNTLISIESMREFFSNSLPICGDRDVILDRDAFAEVADWVKNPRPPTRFLRDLMAATR
jgi:uncharacterized phage-associated protein